MNGEIFQPLGTCCSIRSGQTFKGRLDEYPTGQLTVLLPKDISNGKINDQVAKIAHTEVTQLERHILRKGEIIIVNKGTRFNTYLYDGSIPNLLATTAFYVLTPSKNLVAEYLYWYLNQDEAKTYLSENTQGSVIPTITKSILSQLPIPVIPIKSQKHIQEFINKTHVEQDLLKELIIKKEAFTDSYIWEHICQYTN